MIKYVVENLEDPDLDEPKDIPARDQTNKLLMFKWQEEMKRYMDRRDELERGKKRLYALVWGQCTKQIQIELEAADGFEASEKKQDPITLIICIKAITFSFRDQKYVFGSMWRAFKNLFNTTQREDED